MGVQRYIEEIIGPLVQQFFFHYHLDSSVQAAYEVAFLGSLHNTLKFFSGKDSGSYRQDGSRESMHSYALMAKVFTGNLERAIDNNPLLRRDIAQNERNLDSSPGHQLAERFRAGFVEQTFSEDSYAPRFRSYAGQGDGIECLAELCAKFGLDASTRDMVLSSAMHANPYEHRYAF